LQIVSNRARSICYMVKQQQFRTRAELTVNRLMASSEQQLSTLTTISQTQEQLKAIADSTIEQLETGRHQIASDQQQLKQAQRIMNSQILRNLEHIQQRKEAIIAGNEQLITKTEQIQQKLDSTSEQISEQAELQSTRHTELLRDLTQLGTQAEDVSSKLDASTTLVKNFQRNVIEHQLDVVENLKHINDTVNFLLSLLNSVRDVVDAKLELILYVTSSMGITSIIAVHMLYAVSIVILSVLLHVRRRICHLLMIVVLLNAAAEFKFNSGFGFMRLVTVLVAVGLMASVLAWCLGILFHRRSAAVSTAALDSNADLSSEDIKHVIKTLERLSADFPRRLSGFGEQENERDAPVCSSTPVRRQSESGFDSLITQKTAEFPLDCTPPPIRRHVFPIVPDNPPPSPLIDEGSVMNESGILRLPLLAAGDGSRPGSPASTASCSGTPRAGRQRKSRSSILNRSLNRPACGAVTKSGQNCKLSSQEGSPFCHRHQFN